LRADLPNHACAGDLHQRGIGGVLELCVRVGLPEISDRAVIGDVGATVGTEPNIRRAVETGDPADEGLFEGPVVGKSLKIQAKRLIPLLREIEQFDLVSRLGRRRAGVRCRKPEIALEALECGTLQHRSTGK
jgi:hypothetical protein